MSARIRGLASRPSAWPSGRGVRRAGGSGSRRCAEPSARPNGPPRHVTLDVEREVWGVELRTVRKSKESVAAARRFTSVTPADRREIEPRPILNETSAEGTAREEEV